MNPAVAALILTSAWVRLAGAATPEPGCREAAPVPLRWQMAGTPVRDDVLVGGNVPGIALVGVTDRNVWWQAGAGGDATLHMPEMRAPIGGSIAAIDINGDGLHDRIYAGDRRGRLWRFDLHTGAPPARWATGVLLAELGADDGSRGFVAAPDVSLVVTSAGRRWLSIAIGTARTAQGTAPHRFYVLRDDVGPAAPATVLTEEALRALAPPLGVAADEGPGYFLDLGVSQVLARSLTLSGFIHFSTVETATRLLAACDIGLPTTEVPVSVIVLRADGAVTADVDEDGQVTHRDLRRRLGQASASAAIELRTAAGGRSGFIACHLDDVPVPGCELDTRLRRTYWLREDAQ